jgi:hypothetical protein
VRLIEVLGDYQFLGALLVLMIDANIKEGNAVSSFELPLAIWSSFPGPLCVAVSILPPLPSRLDGLCAIFVLSFQAIAHITAEVETLLGLSPEGELGILPAKK